MPRGCYKRKPNAKKKWTPAEEDYLKEAWGKTSLKSIAVKLGRSEAAILNRVQHLGLGPALAAGERITWNQFVKAIYGNSSGEYEKKRLLAAGFPVHSRIVRGGNNFRYTMVDIEEFWAFAESHKYLFDFARMEPLIFGQEPERAAIKRKADAERLLKHRPHNIPWTAAEDGRLKRYLQQYKYTYKDLADMLRRTEGAVKRRIITLGIKERPIRNASRNWTPDEEEKLVRMKEQGVGWEKIAEELNRSALCCRGKYERILNPEYSKRFYRNARESAGTHREHPEPAYIRINEVRPGDALEHRRKRLAAFDAAWAQEEGIKALAGLDIDKNFMEVQAP